MATKSQTSAKWEALHKQAHAAGMAALEAAQPVPMIVGKALGLSNTMDPDAPKYYVADGVCGFAWVEVPTRSGFGRWAKESGNGSHSSYYKCVMVRVRAGGQSLERKEAYAQAYAGVLTEAGIKAYVGSRMD